MRLSDADAVSARRKRFCLLCAECLMMMKHVDTPRCYVARAATVMLSPPTAPQRRRWRHDRRRDESRRARAPMRTHAVPRAARVVELLDLRLSDAAVTAPPREIMPAPLSGLRVCAERAAALFICYAPRCRDAMMQDGAIIVALRASALLTLTAISRVVDMLYEMRAIRCRHIRHPTLCHVVVCYTIRRDTQRCRARRARHAMMMRHARR